MRDSGLFHALLGVNDWHALMGHPKAGASWEGFAIEQVLAILRVRAASIREKSGICWRR